MPWPVHSYGTEGLPGMAQQMWGQTERRKEKIEDRSWNTGLASIKAGTATDIEIEQMTQGNRQQAQSLTQMRDSAKVEAKRVKEKQALEMGDILLNRQIKGIATLDFLVKTATNYPDSGAAKKAAELASKLTGSSITEQMIMNKETMKVSYSKQAQTAVNAAQGAKTYTEFQNKSAIAQAMLNSSQIPKDLKDYLTTQLKDTTTKRDAEQNRTVTMTNKEGRVAKVPVKNIPTMEGKGFTRGTAAPKPGLMRGASGAMVEKGVGVQGYDKAPAPRYVRTADGTYKEAASGVQGYDKAPAPKAAQNWILADRTNVISQDGGRTYMGRNGQTLQMPPDAIKVPGGATLGEMNMNRAKQQAQQELNAGTTGTQGISPQKAALEGTGPYARVASAFEAVAGGLGLDKLVGKEGLFPGMADAKQYLRVVKQTGKAALLNSARGATWEQEKIEQLFPDPDKTITNPRIEARKFKNLISVLSDEKKYNNQAIVNAVTPKEIEKYRTSNNEIDRLFALISEPSGAKGKLTQPDEDLINKYLVK